MKKENRGQIRVIEALLAIFVIFSSLVISANLTVSQNTASDHDAASIGSQALLKLDSDGSLGKCIDNGNWTALRDALNLVLPAGVTFNLTVYDEQMQQVNNAVISNGGFSSQEIAFVEYVCASQGSVFHCYILHLYLTVIT